MQLTSRSSHVGKSDLSEALLPDRASTASSWTKLRRAVSSSIKDESSSTKLSEIASGVLAAVRFASSPKHAREATVLLKMNEFKKERDERKIAAQRKIFYTGIFFRVLGGIGLVYQLLALKAGTTAQIVVFLLFSGCRVE